MLKKVVIIVACLLLLTSVSTVAAVNYFRGNDEGVVVLMYHDFGYSKDPKIITPEVFEEHLAALAESDYDVISMDQFVAYTEGRLELDRKSVLLTFDDGYEDFYEIAYPTLMKYNFPATNFIIVNFTETHNPNVLPHLTWDQLREMKENGYSFYSHTYNHHLYLDPLENKHAALTSKKENETDEQYVGRVKSDLRYAHELLVQELGEQPNILSFPYGRYTDELLEICEELGITHSFTINKNFSWKNILSNKKGINQVGSTVHTRINAGLSDISGEDLIEMIKRQ